MTANSAARIISCLCFLLVITPACESTSPTECDGCLVDGTCHEVDTVNPDSPCQMCIPAFDTKGWSPFNDGEPCGDGATCDGGDCCAPGEQYSCDDSQNVIITDSCGRPSIVMSCGDLNLSCVGDRCECDPVDNVGCLPDEKCTFVADTAAPSGAVDCARDGTALVGQFCTVDPVSGADNCVGGSFCNGICETFCRLSADDCTGADVCVPEPGLFGDDDIGTCRFQCDLVNQDCPLDQGCYVSVYADPTTFCASPVPEDGSTCPGGATAPGIQDECCSFLDSCAPGFGCTLLESTLQTGLTCAFFCDPTDPGSAAICTASAGAGYGCAALNGFYGDLDDWPLHIGHCIPESEWGPASCMNGVQDGDEAGVDCCPTPAGACPCSVSCT